MKVGWNRGGTCHNDKPGLGGKDEGRKCGRGKEMEETWAGPATMASRAFGMKRGGEVEAEPADMTSYA